MPQQNVVTLPFATSVLPKNTLKTNVSHFPLNVKTVSNNTMLMINIAHLRYIKELEICTLQADLEISFADVYDLHKAQSNDIANNTIAPQTLTHNSPPNINISSQFAFPPIMNKIRTPTSQLNRQIINHKPPNVSAK